MNLYHYYEKKNGPFRNLSDLSLEGAEVVLNTIRNNKNIYASQRDSTYMRRRFEYETLTRQLFIEKGGKPLRLRPHYMTVGRCDWMLSWYENGAFLIIPAEKLDSSEISFTYGDMFPTFGPRGDDSTEYRKNVYTYPEILELVKRLDLPQNWNPDGKKGPIRYIEAQVWSDETIAAVLGKSGVEL